MQLYCHSMYYETFLTNMKHISNETMKRENTYAYRSAQWNLRNIYLEIFFQLQVV